MIVLLVQLVMSAATLAFAAGLLVRHRRNALHRKLMLLGFALTLAIAGVLVAGVHLFGATYGPAPWLVSLAGGEERARGVLIAHRLLATVTLLLLVAQVYAGLRRLPAHRRIARLLIPAWLISYLTGMIIFS